MVFFFETVKGFEQLMYNPYRIVRLEIQHIITGITSY